MRIKKTSQYIEGGASLSNVYGTSQSNGYTQEYINGLGTYSTTEQRIGTWIDGKPLYRKTFYLTSNLSSPLDIQHGIQNVSYMKVEGHLTTSTTSTPPFYATSIDYFRVFRNQNLLSARYGTGITASSITFIVEYTKTTDTAQNTRSIPSNDEVVEEDNR